MSDDPSLVDIGWGCFLRREVREEAVTDGRGYRLRVILVEQGFRAGRYLVAELAFRDDDPAFAGGVTLEDLRSFALASALAQAATDPDIENHLRQEAAMVEGRAEVYGAGGGEREDMVSIAVTAYRYGFALGHKPTAIVTELLAVSRSTASRWIADARRTGRLQISEAAASGGIRLSSEQER